MQFTLTCESVKGKAPVPSTLSSLPSRWGILYPSRPLVRHLLERNSIWTSSGGVQFPPSPLPPVSPAAFSSIATFSQLSYFGFILPSSLVLCHTLPQVEIPPKKGRARFSVGLLLPIPSCEPEDLQLRI